MRFDSPFDERRLLVTDLDGTLIGGTNHGLEKLQAALSDVREAITLAYVSGQSLNEQMAVVEENKLLLPDYIISSVGTEIHRLPGKRSVCIPYQPDRFASASPLP